MYIIFTRKCTHKHIYSKNMHPQTHLQYTDTHTPTLKVWAPTHTHTYTHTHTHTRTPIYSIHTHAHVDNTQTHGTRIHMCSLSQYRSMYEFRFFLSYLFQSWTRVPGLEPRLFLWSSLSWSPGSWFTCTLYLPANPTVNTMKDLKKRNQISPAWTSPASRPDAGQSHDRRHFKFNPSECIMVFNWNKPRFTYQKYNSNTNNLNNFNTSKEK